jgi:hypothetical protein
MYDAPLYNLRYESGTRHGNRPNTHRLSVDCTNEEWEVIPVFLRLISEMTEDTEFWN